MAIIPGSKAYVRTLCCSFLLLLAGCDLVGGAFEHKPADIQQLSAEATALIKQSLADLTPAQITDYHTHIVGLSPDTIGTFVNESWQSPMDPAGYVKFTVYKSAAAVTHDDNIDQQFLDRLNDLVTHLPYAGKFGIMAFDYFHDAQGRIHKDLTTFHVPNEYVMDIASKYPQRYFPILSIHPYRKDAVSALENYARQGVRFIKWLPNAMGINPTPDDPELRQQLIDYYQIMFDYNMVLISHTGDEKATEAEQYQHLGNPLYLQLPLDMGVKIVMAHLASLGECQQLEAAICQPGTPYFDLAIEMMQQEKYRQNLFADISALTQFNRLHVLDRLIETTDIHDRLINGSDYPLPAVNFVIQTRALQKAGHITAAERSMINEIYDVNPLLFDFVLKRTIKHSTTGARLPASIFMQHPRLQSL